MANDAFQNATDAFQSWFDALPGATFGPDIALRDLRSQAAGRGIIALKDIPAGKVVFTIPRSSILTISTSNLAEEVPEIFATSSAPVAGGEQNGDGDNEENGEDDSAHDPWSHLILVLMYEHLRGAHSPWKPYLDVLPSSFDTPMFWSDAELAELQASPVLARIGRADAEAVFRRKIIPVLREHSAVFFPDGNLPADGEMMALAHRMGSAVMAYAFDLEGTEDENEDEDEGEDGWVEDREGRGMLGMVPMADMLNADAEFNAHVNHEEDCLTVTTLRPVKAGEEIINYYGPRPNSEVLRRYGYVTPGHARYDVVEIPRTLPESVIKGRLAITDSVWKALMERIDDDGIEDSFDLERDPGEVESDGTFAGPAVLNKMPASLVDHVNIVLRAARQFHPGSFLNKRKRDALCHAVIEQCVDLCLAKYPTTLRADEEMLAAADLPPRTRMALEVRIGEKRLLEEARELLGRRRAETPQTAKKQKRAAADRQIAR